MIYSSSPPHSLQLIAQKIAKQNKIKWVADFRDPWSELVHYQSYKRTWLTRKIDSHFEKSVFRSADRLIAAANEAVELRSFSPATASMNDVFIRAVGSNNAGANVESENQLTNE